ncbi:MAG: hypothetical protein KatS3mg110_0980 [Pirellulaceae bacterium]|nr:MAG: hypothetical protein KatS3mg110_0980 [Pirellulaceae bacterium]
MDIAARQGLGPPQFGLRTLLLVVAAFAFVLAVQIWAGPLAAAAVAFFLLTIAAHMASTWLGNQMRREAAQRIEDERLLASQKPPPPQAPIPPAVDSARHNYLRRRGGLGWRIVAAGAAGAATGMLLGALVLALSLEHNASWVAWTCGLCAFSTLGALGGFALVSFAVSLYRSWKNSE